MTRRTKKDLREILEIITPTFRDCFGLIFFFLSLAETFIFFGFGPK